MAEVSPEVVVLIHGLWMRGIALALLSRRLRACGFRTYLFSYPTVRLTLPENAHRLSEFARRIDALTLHFVGHSLGGLVILQMLRDCPDPRSKRAVLLGSPYGECFAATRLARFRAGRLVLGCGLPQWLNTPRPQLKATSQIGVIAGSRSLGGARLLGPIPEPNDGVVTVAETQVPGMRDHIVLPVAHSEMLFSSAVAHQTCAFLRRGQFRRVSDIGAD